MELHWVVTVGLGLVLASRADLGYSQYYRQHGHIKDGQEVLCRHSYHGSNSNSLHMIHALLACQKD